jgi:hypothetical protein
MDQATEQSLRVRAKYRCEYCRFPEAFAEVPFQLDHVIAKQHGGQTKLENLALACCFCNRYKGPNLSGIDPDTGQIAPLFHPRNDIWENHFTWEGARLLGHTPAGRATIHALRLNRADALAVRTLLMREGNYPAD